MKRSFKKIRLHLRRRRREQARRFRRLRKHPVMIPVLTFFGLCFITGLGYLVLNHGAPKFTPLSNYIVILSHDHQVQTIPTNEPTVGDLLDKLHIQVAKGDRVEPSPTTPIMQDNLRINVYRALPVEIVWAGQRSFVYSAGTTPRAIAAQAGITVYPEDNVKIVEVDNFLSQMTLAKQVVIDPSTPVNVNIFGTPTVIRTHTKTVGELLKSENIKLGKNDTVQPAENTVLTANAQVFLIHSGTKIVTETQTISMPIQTIRDNSLSFGTSAVRQQGSPGQRVVTYQIDTKNGVEVGRTLIQTVVTVQPVTQIVAQGQAVSIPADKQAVMAQAGISSSDYPYVDYIASHEGAWCPTKIQGRHDCPAYMNASDVPSYGGYGIFQATPGSKMASAGSDWVTSAVTQIRWATGYANARYGGWAGAYNHWTAYHNW